MSENIREIVLDALIILDTGSAKSHLLIRDILDKYDYLDRRDKAFFKRLTEGTVSYTLTLDYIIDSFSKKPVAKCKPVVRAILRMSAYQLLFMEKVPDSAVCDEAVKLCRKRSFEEFCPFVNGILRSISKNKEKCLDFSNIKEESLRLSVKYSCPEWIVKMFLKEQKDVDRLLEGLLRIRPTCVKILDDALVETLLDEWTKAGILYKESKFIKNAFLLENFEGLETVSGFADGKLLVQDESSMMVAGAVADMQGKDITVIDVCAAPGGKSAHVASFLGKNSKVISCDISDRKVDLIKENVERLHLSNVEPTVWDATLFNPEFEGIADVLIADVPCSGLGVMARKSDIKYNITNEAMKEICDLQKQIVLNVSRYLKPGGIFIYSTCTLHKAENEKMVKFIVEKLGFEPDSLRPVLPALFDKERDFENAIALLPHVEGTDGFFVSRFIKKAE